MRQSHRIRPVTPEEREYTYRLPAEETAKSGLIGYLRGDFGKSGKEFWTSWFDVDMDLKTQSFQAEADNIVNNLRRGRRAILKNLLTMERFVMAFPSAEFEGSYCPEYAFRIVTAKYTYLLRCNLTRGDYNFYLFCYVSAQLQRCLPKATPDEDCSQDIRDAFN